MQRNEAYTVAMIPPRRMQRIGQAVARTTVKRAQAQEMINKAEEKRQRKAARNLELASRGAFA